MMLLPRVPHLSSAGFPMGGIATYSDMSSYLSYKTPQRPIYQPSPFEILSN